MVAMVFIAYVRILFVPRFTHNDLYQGGEAPGQKLIVWLHLGPPASVSQSGLCVRRPSPTASVTLSRPLTSAPFFDSVRRAIPSPRNSHLSPATPINPIYRTFHSADVLANCQTSRKTGHSAE